MFDCDFSFVALCMCAHHHEFSVERIRSGEFRKTTPQNSAAFGRTAQLLPFRLSWEHTGEVQFPTLISFHRASLSQSILLVSFLLAGHQRSIRRNGIPVDLPTTQCWYNSHTNRTLGALSLFKVTQALRHVFISEVLLSGCKKKKRKLRRNEKTRANG
jgi:hypothetical protein